MNIVVCLKQVPDTTAVKIDPKTGTLIRDGVPSIINPEDKGNNNINNTNIKVEQNSEENTKTDINSEVSPVITLFLGIISALVGCVPIIRGK